MTAIVVGKTEFRDIVADGNVRFIVRKDMKNGTYQCISDDVEWSGVERFFSGAQIRAKLAQEKAIQRMFASQDDFWEQQEVGTVLHYHNGFGQFLRGEVVLLEGKKQLQPTALVGTKWNLHSHYMPKRKINGDIDLGYYGEKIIKRTGAWQPSESCVYESALYARHNDIHGDPRVMEPLDLTVPDMTPAEAANAELERVIDRVRGVLEARYQTSAPPREVIDEIHEIVARASTPTR